ncbi:MAG: deoxyribodipyrimidine photo-lyase [Chitinophagaceae bacterium]|nr:deoxyribodipyrimidine photo-lyase [Chitinophagaceae bacterium]
MQKANIFWFRRDLRLADNAGLYYALKDTNPVIPIFIFDKNILDKLDDKKDRRVEFIYKTIIELKEQLQNHGAALQVFYDVPVNIFTHFVSKYKIEKVFTNQDYEPYAIERDDTINELLKINGASLVAYKDQVIFEKDEITKDDTKPYTIFTPYSKKWKDKFNVFFVQPYPTEKYFTNFYRSAGMPVPSLKSIGFEAADLPFPHKIVSDSIIKNYYEKRNFPAEDGTSRLGLHLRFGTISIRKLASKAHKLNQTFLNELIWRDFYHSILWHFPHVGRHKAFKPVYDNIEWRNNEEEFRIWCIGETGYPIVDAGMRQLNETGFMHNRVRMIVASFLSKHLLIDWRWGEAYFAEKLLDYDLASNNGGWQWAAGSGCDAAPYFRIFNPYLQTKKFDPDLKYISKWVPEFQEFSYPRPIVEHEFARKRCLEVFGRAVASSE